MTYYCERCLSEHESPDFVCVDCEGDPMNPKKFRKKPALIEAMRFTRAATSRHGYEVAAWCGGRFNAGPPCTISIPTLEGVMTASEGDWIIRGVQGEFYPCKPDIFAATYEPAEETR